MRSCSAQADERCSLNRGRNVSRFEIVTEQHPTRRIGVPDDRALPALPLPPCTTRRALETPWTRAGRCRRRAARNLLRPLLAAVCRADAVDGLSFPLAWSCSSTTTRPPSSSPGALEAGFRSFFAQSAAGSHRLCKGREGAVCQRYLHLRERRITRPRRRRRTGWPRAAQGKPRRPLGGRHRRARYGHANPNPNLPCPHYPWRLT